MDEQNMQSIKSKAFSISAVMKNPKLSKALFDAWDAPAGSTKNTKAKSILKSLAKSSGNYSQVIEDGKGGAWGNVRDWFSDKFGSSSSSGQPQSSSTTMSVAPQVTGAAPNTASINDTSVFQGAQPPRPVKFIPSVDQIRAQKKATENQYQQNVWTPEEQAKIDYVKKNGQMPTNDKTMEEQATLDYVKREGKMPAAGVDVMAKIGPPVPTESKYGDVREFSEGEQAALDLAKETKEEVVDRTKDLGKFAEERLLTDQEKALMSDFQAARYDWAMNIKGLVRDDALKFAMRGNRTGPVDKPTDLEEVGFSKWYRMTFGQKVERHMDKWKNLWDNIVYGVQSRGDKDLEKVLAISPKDKTKSGLQENKWTAEEQVRIDEVKRKREALTGETGATADTDTTADTGTTADTTAGTNATGTGTTDGKVTEDEIAEAYSSTANKSEAPITIGKLGEMTDKEKEFYFNENPQFKDLFGYVDGNYDPSSVNYDGGAPLAQVYRLMSDTALLAKTFNLPEEVIKTLPASPFFYSQIPAMREEVKARYDLEAKQDNLLDLQNAKVNRESDFNTIVRGRDTYLNKINNMREDFITQVSKMDTSNPYVAERMDTYLNYLTILKGRQNQRYVDYVQSEIDNNEAELQRVTNQYNLDYARYQEDFEDTKNEAKESYDFYKDMLTEMVTYPEVQAEKLRDLEMWELDKTHKEHANSMDILNIQEKKEEMSSSVSEDIDGKDFGEDGIYSQIVGDYGKDAEGKSTGNFSFLTYSPTETRVRANKAGQVPDAAVMKFNDMVYQQTKKQVGINGEFSTDFMKISAGLEMMALPEETAMLLENTTQEEIDSFTDEQKEYYNKIVDYNNDRINTSDKLRNGLWDGLGTYLSGDGKSEELRNAINALINKPKTYLDNKNKYVEKYNDIGSVADYIHEYTLRHVAIGDTIASESKDESARLTPEQIWQGAKNLTGSDLVFYVQKELSNFYVPRT